MAQSIFSNDEIIEYIGIDEDTVDAVRTAEAAEYEAVANKFLNKLINKLVYQKVSTYKFTNPFRQYYKEALRFGDGIENVYVDKLAPRKYDRDGTDPFAIAKNRVSSTYARLNVQLQYVITVYRDELRQAVLTEGGLQTLTNKLIANLALSMDMDEYQLCVIMLNNEDIYADGFETIDVHEYQTVAEQYGAVCEKIAEVTKDFKMPSISNNKLGVMNASNIDDLLIVAKADVITKIDFKYLAGLYNMSMADIKAKVVEIRSFKTVVNSEEGGVVASSLEGEDLDFVIIDTRGIDIHEVLRGDDAIYNPTNRATNYFNNLWAVFGFNHAFQARAFKIQFEAAAAGN